MRMTLVAAAAVIASKPLIRIVVVGKKKRLIASYLA